MATTVYLHVGVAKTGTTYLQRILFAHREALKSAGLLYPGRRPGDQFVAAIDLRKLGQDKFRHLKADGAWERMAADVRRFDGNVIISHETLARCSRAEGQIALESFGGAEVRVVVTVRDLARQIPAVWQETLKNRATDSYPEFLNNVFVNVDSGEYKFFWRPQDVAKVIQRWGAIVGMDNLAVVTVPPTGAPRDELWRRFSAAIDLPDVEIALPSAASNTSLGPAEAELLRYLNAALPRDLGWPRYARIVKRQFAESQLAARPSGRITVPQVWHKEINRLSHQTVKAIRRSGCTVIGELADLHPQLKATATPQPDELATDVLMTTAAEVIRDLLVGSTAEVDDETDTAPRRRLRNAARRLRLGPYA